MISRSDDPKSLRDEVFSAVFDAHWAAIRHHVEGVVVDDGEVTQIVSEVFVTAWARLNPRKPMGRIWLLRAADRALRGRAHDARTRSSAAAAVHDGLRGPRDETDAAEHAAVLRALSVLAARERRIIVLTYWDGLSVGEIAELSRSSVARVRKTLLRAQAHAREALRSEGVIVDD
jgi:RNA polymerase sigma factor (sigma-70 family)